MRTIRADTLIKPLARKIEAALYAVHPDTLSRLKDAAAAERGALCAWALRQIVRNDEIAASEKSYACQDCGQAVFWVTMGRDLHVEGNLDAALEEAVRLGYRDARKSVADPLTRRNTKDNTPAIVSYDFCEGDALTVRFLAKGAGSENMAGLYMLTPSKGEDGIVNAVVDCVTCAGAKPCPPLLLGIGIGGTADVAAKLSKHALMLDERSTRADVVALEKRIYDAVNATGIGAQGFGGDCTALDVRVCVAPTHIGMLPVCVTVQCHSDRRFTAKF